MAQLVASKYAKALFDIAVEGDVSTLSKEVHTFYDVLINEKAFRETLLSPRITSDEKIDIVSKSFSDLSSSMKGFIAVVLKKNRESELLTICEIFFELVEEHTGVLKAQVYSVTDLTDEQTSNIKQLLAKKTNKDVDLVVIKDETLIGGIKIKAGGFVFDGSIRKQLEDMKHCLL